MLFRDLGRAFGDLFTERRSRLAVGALLVAIVVAMLVQAKLGGKSHDAGPSSQILVANKRLVTGSQLKQEDVRWQDWPETAVFSGMIQKKDYPDDKQPDVFNTPLRRTLESGEPITTQALIADSKGSNSFLAASITPGMRAVALPITLETSAGGFVLPGDHVDIVLAYSAQIPSDAQAYADQVVGDVDEAFATMKKKYGDNLPSMMNLNTGPSRTADIEKTLVVGVHGPAEVFCFFVNADSGAFYRK